MGAPGYQQRWERRYAPSMADEARERIQKLLVTGDNRLKQGVSAEKVRETYDEALAVAREAGLEDAIRPLVEVRLADLQRLAGGSAPPDPPAA
jgi:ribosomal protein S4